MLRAGAFITMRQKQRETAETLPLRLTRADELIDDDLGAVGKVTVLPFPNHERIRLGGGIAVLKAHHRFLGQNGIDHLHTGLMICDVLERNVGIVTVLIVQNCMPVEEGSTPAVLT